MSARGFYKRVGVMMFGILFIRRRVFEFRAFYEAYDVRMYVPRFVCTWPLGVNIYLAYVTVTG
jgi:hypothetical protein